MVPLTLPRSKRPSPTTNNVSAKQGADVLRSYECSVTDSTSGRPNQKVANCCRSIVVL